MLLSTLLFCHLLCGILCAILARRLGKPALQWFLLAIPFGVLTLFFLLFKHDRVKTSTNSSAVPD